MCDKHNVLTCVWMYDVTEIFCNTNNKPKKRNL